MPETTDLVIVTDRLDGDDPAHETAAGMFAALAAHLLRSPKSPTERFDSRALEMFTVAAHAFASGFAMGTAPVGEERDDQRPDVHAAVAMLGRLLQACRFERDGSPEQADTLRRHSLTLARTAFGR